MNASSSREAVLIADDDPDTVETLSVVLDGYGFEALTAFDGAEAIQIAKKRIPQSIILDVALPVVNGFEIAKELRASASFHNTTIIGLSGYAGENFIESAQAAGMDYYLSKPADIEVLLNCLKLKATSGSLTLEELQAWSLEAMLINDEIRNRVAVLSERSRRVVARALEICRKYGNVFAPPPRR